MFPNIFWNQKAISYAVLNRIDSFKVNGKNYD